MVFPGINLANLMRGNQLNAREPLYCACMHPIKRAAPKKKATNTRGQRLDFTNKTRGKKIKEKFKTKQVPP